MGEVSDVIGGGTPKTKVLDNYKDGTIPWITPADLSGYTEKFIGYGSRFITEIGLSSSSARMMPVGTVLFTSRAPIGYVAIANNDISTNQGFKSFVLKSRDILPDYVYWWLKGNKELAESYASGTTFLELSGSKAKQLPIPIAPFDQQKRIVAEIEKQFSRLDEAVASLKRVKANLKRYKAAVLKAAVEGKLTEEWRQQHPDVEPANKLLERISKEREARFQKSLLKWQDAVTIWKASGKEGKKPAKPRRLKDLPSLEKNELSTLLLLPQGWIWSRLGNLNVDVFDGPFGSNLKSSDYVENGIRVIRLENIGSLEFVDEKVSFVTEEKYAQLKKHSVGVGDLIFSSFVADATRVVMLPAHVKTAINKADCFCVRIFGETVKGSYLEIFLATRNAYEQLVAQVHGATRPRINTTQLKNCLVALPPAVEQPVIIDELTRQLSVVEVLNRELDMNIIRADRLRQAILKKAFSGQLVASNEVAEPGGER